MVRRYALIAQMDIARAHRKAGPADNWGLEHQTRLAGRQALFRSGQQLSSSALARFSGRAAVRSAPGDTIEEVRPAILSVICSLASNA